MSVGGEGGEHAAAPDAGPGPGVRLRYPMLVNYASLALRLASSLAFAILVARKLPVGEYGAWGVILSLSTTLVEPVILISTWTPRMEAWGHRGAGYTGLLLSTAYSALASAAFIVAARVVIGADARWPLAAALIPAVQALYSYLRQLASTARPESVGYSLVLYEAVRLPAAYLLVARLGLGLLGAVASVLAAYAMAAAYMAAVAVKAGYLEPRLLPGLPARLVRLSYISMSNIASRLLMGFYRGFFKLVTGSLEAVARLNVGLAAEAPLLQASWLGPSLALYARMLRRASVDDLAESIRVYLAFSGFFLTSLAVLARPVAAVFNPAYIDAAWLVALASVHALLYGLANIYGVAIGGAERLDADPERLPPPREVLSSPMGRASLARLLALAGQYTLLAVSYRVIHPGNPAGAALLAVVAMLASMAALLVYLYRLASIVVGPSMPWRTVGEVSLAALATVAAYVALGAPWEVVTRFWPAVTRLAPTLVLGALVYGGVLLAVSAWARGLVRAVVRYVAARA